LTKLTVQNEYENCRPQQRTTTTNHQIDGLHARGCIRNRDALELLVKRRDDVDRPGDRSTRDKGLHQLVVLFQRKNIMFHQEKLKMLRFLWVVFMFALAALCVRFVFNGVHKVADTRRKRSALAMLLHDGGTTDISQLNANIVTYLTIADGAVAEEKRLVEVKPSWLPALQGKALAKIGKPTLKAIEDLPDTTHGLITIMGYKYLVMLNESASAAALVDF